MADVCTNGVDTGFVALGYAKVAALGVLQGVTELFPISSTAHMRVVPALLGWQDPGSAFSAAMQLAALGGVVTYFWRDLRILTLGAGRALWLHQWDDWCLRFVVWMGLATVPIAAAGMLLAHTLNTCGSPLRTLTVIGVACLLMSLLLALAELAGRHRRGLEHVSLTDALIVGIAQMGALIPGVSRSGATFTAALWLDLRREEAARFSFLLGLPAIALAGGKEIYDLWKVNLDLEAWSILGVGVAVGTISAFFAVWGLLRILERFSSWPFVIYRAALGIFLIVGVAQGWLTN